MRPHAPSVTPFIAPKSRIELSMAINDAPVHIVKRTAGKSIRYDVDVEGRPMEFTTATSAEKWLSTVAPSPELFYSTVYLDSRRPSMAFHAPANRFDMISALLGLDAFDRVRDHLQLVRTTMRKDAESIDAMQSRRNALADEMADLQDLVGPMRIEDIVKMRKAVEKDASRRMLAKDLIRRASKIPEADRVSMHRDDVDATRRRAHRMMDEDRARDAYTTWRARWQHFLEARGNATVEMATIDPPAEGERDRLVSTLAIASAARNLVRRMQGTEIQDRCPHCGEWIPLRNMLASWVSRFMPTSHRHARQRIKEIDRYVTLRKDATAVIRSERPRRLFGKGSGNGAQLMRRVHRAIQWMKILADSRRYGVNLDHLPPAERIEDLIQLEVSARRLLDIKKEMAALDQRIPPAADDCQKDAGHGRDGLRLRPVRTQASGVRRTRASHRGGAERRVPHHGQEYAVHPGSRSAGLSYLLRGSAAARHIRRAQPVGCGKPVLHRVLFDCAAAAHQGGRTIQFADTGRDVGELGCSDDGPLRERFAAGTSLHRTACDCCDAVPREFS